MRRIVLPLLLVVACDPPSKEPAKPTPAKAENKQAPEPEESKDSEGAEEAEPDAKEDDKLVGPAANATPEERRKTVLALLGKAPDAD